MSINYKAASLIRICLCIALLSASASEAKTYIDIVKAPRRMPIAVMELTGPYGEQISGIIREDLSASGIFDTLPPKEFRERPGQRFNISNWEGSPAEAVLKGEVKAADELTATVVLYDIYDGSVIMSKQYRAARELIRPISHSIANDIYRYITGKDGVFRTRIAYVAKSQGKPSITVADWDGMRSRELAVTADSILAPRWHSSGQEMIFSAQRGYRWDIHRLRLSNMREEQVVTLEGVNLAGGYFPSGGDFVFSSSAEGSPDLYIHREGKPPERITSGLGIEVSPSVSPDGKRVAYVSDQSGTPQVYIMELMGYNTARVTYEGRYNTSPVWSPDGEQIAFSGWFEGRNQVYTVWPEGRGLRKLTSEGNNEEPSYSPDGRFIAFTSDRDGYKAVYIMRANGSDQRRISPERVNASSPRWSPN